MDDIRYEKYSSSKENEFESICSRCGECCGSLDDPCVNLVRRSEKEHYCKNYENRFGPQKTLSGNSFTCVSIREHILNGSLRPGCGYRKIK